MTALMVLIATAAIGVEVGWQPLAGGGHEYTVQIEPELLRTLEHNDITSEVPPQVDVREIRITLGTGKLARIDGERAARQAPQASEPETPIESGSPHLANESVETEPSTGQRTPYAAPPGGADMPAQFTEPTKHPKQLGHTTPGQDAEAHGRNTEKPTLPDEVGRPWLPFLIAAVLLSCSLGANVYLAWIAWDAQGVSDRGGEIPGGAGRLSSAPATARPASAPTLSTTIAPILGRPSGRPASARSLRRGR